MTFRKSFIRLCGPVTLAYKQHFPTTTHPEQLALASRLDSLHKSLTMSEQQQHREKYLDRAIQHYSKKSFSPMIFAQSLFLSRPPKGIYIYGSVGVGKSFLMDLFYQQCCLKRTRRCHFHEFMLSIHEEIHAFKKKFPRSDPIPAVATAIARDTRLLCLDEMQVTDIADAMVLKRLLTLLLDVGVVIVTTSNRPPEALYEGGLNRSLFLPFIDVLNEHLTVVEMNIQQDYRRMSNHCNESSMVPTYVWPSDQDNSRRILEEWFQRASGSAETTSKTIPVAMGRSLKVKRASGKCAWFHFDELCHQPLGAADYLALAQHYSTIIVDDIPQLDENHYNEARRFVTLIDALYESRTQLILSAAVPREELLVEFEAQVVSQDGDEEISMADSVVIGEGGSSSSHATTTIPQKDGSSMEWSATGRIGVSLAQLSSVREVSFSFQRAASRLAEMCQPRPSSAV